MEGPELCRGCSVAGGLKVGEAVSSMNISVFARDCGRLLGLEGEKKGENTFPCTCHPHLLAGGEEGQWFVGMRALQIVPHYFLKLSFYLAKT